MVFDSQEQKTNLLQIVQLHHMTGTYTQIRETIAVVDKLISDISNGKVLPAAKENTVKEAVQK